MSTSQSIRTGPMLSDDLDELEELERRASPRPWSRGSLGRQLGTAGDASLVAWLDGTGAGAVAGFVVAHAVLDEVEILNVLVDPALRRRGIGRALVTALLERARADGRGRVLLEVREGNAAARALYEGVGFEEVGRRAAYYRAPTEDAILMTLALP